MRCTAPHRRTAQSRSSAHATFTTWIVAIHRAARFPDFRTCPIRPNCPISRSDFRACCCDFRDFHRAEIAPIESRFPPRFPPISGAPAHGLSQFRQLPAGRCELSLCFFQGRVHTTLAWISHAEPPQIHHRKGGEVTAKLAHQLVNSNSTTTPPDRRCPIQKP